MSDLQTVTEGPAVGATNARSITYCLTEANKALQTWVQNVSRRDIDAVLDLYAPDAILVPTLSDDVREREDSRRRYFEMFLANEGLSCGITVQKGRVSARLGTVVIGGLYCFTMVREGRTEIVPARFLFTFEEIDGRWLITGHHSSQAVE
ncbi:nuclear transport factor 2 family protein [Methylobacterium indicum]|nr:nuclear transport factor 2 family protein [Methylobacterium indicum]